jgi:DnaJ-class molecular chaperone
MFDGTAYLPKTYTCLSCKGAGVFNDGDCELGVWESCEECGGLGEVEE